MSHSTQFGFSEPPSDAPMCSRSGLEFVACFAGLCDFQSDAIGVGQFRPSTLFLNVGARLGFTALGSEAEGHFVPSDDMGVGNVRTAPPRVVPRFGCAAAFPSPHTCGLSCPVGVGHNPDPIPLVRRPGMVRPHNSPSRIMPQRGKVGEDGSKTPLHKQR